MHVHGAYSCSFAEECSLRYLGDWHYHWLLDVELQPDGSIQLCIEHEDTAQVLYVPCPAESLRYLAPYQELLQAWLDDPICNERPLVPVTFHGSTPRFSEAGAHYDYRETPVPRELTTLLSSASSYADQILKALRTPWPDKLSGNN
jgi:hypothetical protein